MKTEKESFSFCRYLQSTRLEKKISLEKVSEETRIGMGVLQIIEKEDLEALPAEVFVRGFLRSFAKAVGVDEGEAVRLYEARLNMENTLADAGSFSGRSSIKFWRYLVLSVAALLSVMALSIYGVSYFQSQVHMPETVEKREVSEKPKIAISGDQQISNVRESVTAESVEKMILQITAVEDTWIKVIIDNKEPNEFNLSVGEQMEIEASAGYNLLIGNAAGLVLKLNEKPIPISGKIGEVVSIQLP
jgi:cytoskeletal protein RodZ